MNTLLSKKGCKLISKIELLKFKKSLAFRYDGLPFFLVYLIDIMVDYYLFNGNGYLFISVPLLITVHVLIYLSTYWSKEWECFINYSKLEYSNGFVGVTHVKVTPRFAHKGTTEIVPLEVDEFQTFCFTYQKRKFLWQNGVFQKTEYPIDLQLSKYITSQGVETDLELVRLKNKYGINEFDIPVPKFASILAEQAVSPFFIFQVFCVFLWSLDDYFYYSIFILLMLLLLECITARSRLNNIQVLRSMRIPELDMRVYRKKKWVQIKTTQLLPGDLVLLSRGIENCVIPCDILLLRGSCTVNESMLTGESTPQMKESICSYSSDELGNTLCLNKHRISIVFGGTKILQCMPDNNENNSTKVITDECLGYVLRTGFGTSQGKLVRTIIFSSQHVTQNNYEVFSFILLLLMFALAASGYVMWEGLKDATRSKWKLTLECMLVLTSVVPPELPIELSLAINTSLMNLTSENIFCTEPYRIPYAGKIEYCAFDKTGTLTEEHLIFKGVATIDDNLLQSLSTHNTLNGVDNLLDKISYVPHSKIPLNTSFVMAGCHSLTMYKEELVGDPIEISALNYVQWKLQNKYVTFKSQRMKICHYFHFQSHLRRMSTLVSLERTEGNGRVFAHMILTKGAPETISKLLEKVPEHYEEVYKSLAYHGARVIALAHRELNTTSSELKQLQRSQVECNLLFDGFLVFDCPLRPDSFRVIKSLNESSHHTVMITGDAALTACAVSRRLGICTKPILIFELDECGDEDQIEKFESNMFWTEGWNEKSCTKIAYDASKIAALHKSYDLCVSGQALRIFLNQPNAKDYIKYVRVFARSSPQDKANIIVLAKKYGFVTFMCGDGTNDVGALKQAHVGVALLFKSKSSRPKKIGPSKFEMDPRVSKEPLKSSLRSFKQALSDMEKEESSVIQLGDASVASPFTSKNPNVAPILSIFKQGRCALVVTLQMFKILALNCLISAYSLSVLYLDGVKFGDLQATVLSLIISICFFSISRSQSSDKLCKRRPISKFFCPYTIASIFGQFAIHLSSLVYLVQQSKFFGGDLTSKLNSEFQPNLTNTVVYLINSVQHMSTIIVNYEGHPFLQSISSNKGLLYSFTALCTLVSLCVLQVFPQFNESFGLVSYPNDFKYKLFAVICIDFWGAWAWELICKWLLT